MRSVFLWRRYVPLHPADGRASEGLPLRNSTKPSTTCFDSLAKAGYHDFNRDQVSNSFAASLIGLSACRWIRNRCLPRKRACSNFETFKPRGTIWSRLAPLHNTPRRRVHATLGTPTPTYHQSIESAIQVDFWCPLITVICVVTRLWMSQ
ncbi:Secondary metabolism regulator laeA [Fusarium oxysporum f. sp. albedinis]|nr:Secondary metabolism regulator laeA [Fusarium oxysporum f. sp. albedinis]